MERASSIAGVRFVAAYSVGPPLYVNASKADGDVDGDDRDDGEDDEEEDDTKFEMLMVDILLIFDEKIEKISLVARFFRRFSRTNIRNFLIFSIFCVFLTRTDD